MGESLVTAVKLSLAIAAGLAFVVAINSIVTFLAGLVFDSSGFITEVLWIMSVFVPFDTNIVMLGLFEAMAAIIAFLISQQVYKLTMLTYKVA